MHDIWLCSRISVGLDWYRYQEPRKTLSWLWTIIEFTFFVMIINITNFSMAQTKGGCGAGDPLSFLTLVIKTQSTNIVIREHWNLILRSVDGVLNGRYRYRYFTAFYDTHPVRMSQSITPNIWHKPTKLNIRHKDVNTRTNLTNELIRAKTTIHIWFNK